MSDGLTISEQYLRKAHEWADFEGAASMLEEAKSSVMSQMMTALGDMPVNRAELKVKASKEWSDYIKRMVDARTKANHAKVELVYLQMRHRDHVGQDANNRLAARL